jgi:hypothetical protein
MAALRLKHPKAAKAEPGSEAWCASKMSGFLCDALSKRRLLTGDTRFDALLGEDAYGYARFRLNGDLKPLVKALRRNAEAFRTNWEGYTSEMRWTDRVVSFTKNYLAYLPEPAPPEPALETLYCSASGGTRTVTMPKGRR